MADLRTDLQRALEGGACLVGIGNVDLGDDAFGVRLAEELIQAGCPDVLVAGTTPERWIGRLASGSCPNVVFLDAVDVGEAPGSALWMDAALLQSRFPQISTHKFSLGTLARLLEGRARAWLLGVQPGSLEPGAPLTSPVRTTMKILKDLLVPVGAGGSRT